MSVQQRLEREAARAGTTWPNVRDLTFREFASRVAAWKAVEDAREIARRVAERRAWR